MRKSSSGEYSYLESGLSKLRTASILYIVSSLLASIGLISVLPFITMIHALPLHADMVALTITKTIIVNAEASAIAFTTMGVAITMLILSMVGGIISLIALFAYLIPSFSDLSKYDESAFSTPYKLLKIGYLLGLILFIVALIIIILGAVGRALTSIILGMVLIIISFILLLLGKIGLAIGMFKLRDRLAETLFLVAGILFIIGIIVTIVDFVGWILVLVATGSALDKLKMKT
ncbi:MAG: hypothetical protein B6U85_07510 [Desulfurococcales archaeon ex4484_42]|nr:MAG: hypothetical protein B6U85_07510 [Desulfurococcales archaeon ex4484_42]